MYMASVRSSRFERSRARAGDFTIPAQLPHAPFTAATLPSPAYPNGSGGNTVILERALGARKAVRESYPAAQPHEGWALRTVDARERARVESFIYAAYRAAYGAKLTAFMPQLTALCRDRDLLAACGLRRAADETLYLETYLDVPVERAIAHATGERVARDRIAEIGNLAIARAGAARMLIAHVTAHLHASHAQWAVFTAVPALRNNFVRLSIPLYALGRAAPERLSAEARLDWGRYYDCAPQVIAVRVADAVAALRVR